MFRKFSALVVGLSACIVLAAPILQSGQPGIAKHEVVKAAGYYEQQSAYGAPPVAPAFARGSDYWNDIVSDEGAFPWLAKSFPLKIWISNGNGASGYRPEYREILIESFNEWCDASQGRLAWQLVDNKREADVTCSFVGSPRGGAAGGGVEGGRTATVTVGDPRGEYIESAEMELLTRLHGKTISLNEFRKAALHECGHAFGLQGHSSNNTDILYAMVRDTQKPYLQPRDINTMMRLYSSYPQRFAIGSIPAPRKVGGGED